MPARQLPHSYEEQQAELQKMESGEELHVEVPKEPEVNPEIYKDVEPFLFRGFLSQAAQINEVEFVFKTLNHHEHELIRLTGGYDEKGSPSPRFWAKFIAYSVLMIDGINILPDRGYWIPKLSRQFEDLPVAVKTKVIRYLSEINRRAKNAVTLTECYALEKYSRYRWFQLQGLDMTSTALTGISGTEQLGMNWGQLIWRALNKIDDIRDGLEQSWEHAKFIGSCSAGKGIQKVYHQDSERRKKERDEQLSRKDAVLRHVLLGEPLHERGTQHSGAVWVTAKTVEELAEQLQSDLRGEKDWHDAVVDNYENKTRDAQKEREDQVRELSRQREVEFGGKALVGTTDMSGLTPTEVRERIVRRRQFEAQAAAGQLLPAPNTVIQEIESSMGTTDKGAQDARPMPVRRPPASPFSKRGG